MSEPPTRYKYHNIPVDVGGERFASKAASPAQQVADEQPAEERRPEQQQVEVIHKWPQCRESGVE